MKTKPGIAPLLANPNDKSSLKFDDEEKARILLKQFSSVFNKEHEGEIPRIPRRTEQSVGELRVTEVMVKKELLSLNINKSSGPDKINPRILIELAEYIAGPIAFLFNMMMNHGVLPRDWKRAFVTPIYKKGSRSHAENYRPISLTCILCKIMEKFVREKVMTHLLENKLLTNK